jgi:hypothetical protein
VAEEPQFLKPCVCTLRFSVEVKLSHLGEDGGLLAAKNADPGANTGNQGSAAQRDADTRDCVAIGVFKEHGKTVFA